MDTNARNGEVLPPNVPIQRYETQANATAEAQSWATAAHPVEQMAETIRQQEARTANHFQQIAEMQASLQRDMRVILEELSANTAQATTSKAPPTSALTSSSAASSSLGKIHSSSPGVEFVIGGRDIFPSRILLRSNPNSKIGISVRTAAQDAHENNI